MINYELNSLESVLAETIFNVNQYTYRGYRYESETGLYYLNSRHYNPEIGRFLNADGQLGQPGNILIHNIYAYASNNPIMNIDPNGNAWYHWALSGAAIVVGAGLIATGGGAVLGAALIGAGVNSMIMGVANEQAGGSFEAGWAAGIVTGAAMAAGASVAGGILVSIEGGALLPVAGAMGIAFVSGYGGGFCGTLFQQTIDGESFNFSEANKNGLHNGAYNMANGVLQVIPSGMLNPNFIGDPSYGGAAVFTLGIEFTFDSVTYLVNKVKEWIESEVYG